MVYKMPMQDGSAVPGAESGMTDSREGSLSLNWGTNAPRLNPFWNTIWGSDRSKKCLNHLSGVPSTAFSILILLLAALPYKPKPYHKFPLSSCKSVFIGDGLFHTLTCFMVFWQSKQSIKIFWEGCGGKKKYYQTFPNAQWGRRNGPASPIPCETQLNLWCFLLCRLCLQSPPLLHRFRESLQKQGDSSAKVSNKSF